MKIFYRQSFYQRNIYKSNFDLASDLAANNLSCMSAINNEYKNLLQKNMIVPQSGMDRLNKSKKLHVRERINKLIDPGSPFLELSQIAGHDLYGAEKVTAGGIITGIGQIKNQYCMIVANDPLIKGGSYYPITIKKHLRAQEIAMQNHIPCVYLVDSGGANLPRQDEVFPDKNHFGRIFYNMAQMSKRRIPQISIVLGFCTAGGAYVPAMSDENIIVKKNGTIFLGGPPLVKAATGEIVSAEDLGGGQMHSSISGVTDHLANNEIEALMIGRRIIGNINGIQIKKETVVEPIYSMEEINSVFSGDLKQKFDSRELITRLVDGSEFDEFKANYGTEIITGFANLYNQPCGIISNNGILFSNSAVKATQFINVCSQRKIPLIFLQNITGFMIGSESEKAGIAKHGAKLVNAVSTTNMPKLTLLFGGSYGAGNYGMCGRAYEPNFLFSWPCSKTSVMGGEQAANVLAQIQKASDKKKGIQWTEEQENEVKAKYTVQYEREGSIYHSSARIWDDGVILPEQTRQALGMALKVSVQKGIEDQNGFGVFRM